MTAIAVDAGSVLLTFSARVSVDGTFTGAEFRLCASEFASSDECPSATAVVANGAIVTLSVPEDALPAESVLWLRYFEGSSGARLVDQDSGAAVEAIAAHPFSTPAAPVVVAPPSLLSAVGDSATVTLTFERALDATSKPPVSAFTANGSAPSAVALDGPIVTLTLAAALADGETAAISYTPPETSALQDTDGVRVAAFSTPIENRTDSAPIAVSAAIDASGASLTLTFSEALSEEPLHQPASDAFSISGGSTAITVAGVTGTSLILTLSPGVLQGQTLRIAYTAPAGGALRDADQGGLSVAAFELDIEKQQRAHAGADTDGDGRSGRCVRGHARLQRAARRGCGPAANGVRDLGTRCAGTRGFGRRRQGVASGASTRGARPVPLDQLQPGSIRRAGIAAETGFRSSSVHP